MKFCFICFSYILFLLTQTNTSKANFNSVYSYDGITVWAAGAAGNVFKSTDGGNTWQSFYVGTADFNSVFVVNSTIWLASQGGSITVSTNSGNNWSTSSGFPPVKSLFFIDASNGFFAGNSGAIYRTTNGGTNWSQITSGTNNNLNCLKFFSSNTGIACGANGTVVLTTNGGSSWSVLSTPTSKELFSIDMKGNTIIAVGADAVVIKSTNGGSTWSVIDYKITTQSDVNSVYMFDANTYYSVGGGGFIRKSTDGGASFTFGINPMLAVLNQIYFFDNNKGWAVSRNTNAVIRTTDGGNTWLFPAGTTQNLDWVLKINGQFTSFGDVFALSLQNKKEIFAALSDSIYRSLDLGENWTQISTVPYGNVSTSLLVSQKDSSSLLLAIDSGFSQHGKILRTTDYGITWNTTFTGNISTDSKPLCFDPNHPDTVYLAPNDSVIFRSTNFGLTWAVTSPVIFKDICILKVLENNSNILICGNKESFQTYNVGRLQRSSNFGQSWTVIDTFTTTINNYGEIPDIATSKLDVNTIYCTYFTTAGGVKKSTNLGLNWTLVNNYNQVWGIDIAKDDPNVVSFANASGSHLANVSIDACSSSFLTNPLPGSNNAILCFNRSTIFAQVASTIYKLAITCNVPIGIKQISSEVPKEFALLQNFPNPFNPSTKINYQLPRNGFVKLTVYDILGRLVAVLVNENQTPGTYEVVFDAANQSSGVYFYTLQTERYSNTKKMVIIK